jgi:2-methylfumaryl-CoA isomerase
MTADPAPMTVVQDATPAVGERLIGFTRDFATADGQRVMVAAFTRQQFADLAKATRLARTFAFLERVLHADFSDTGDLYAHRGVIATMLAPWFSRRTVADVAAAFTGTSVPWAREHDLNGRPSHRGAVRSLKR